jgi:hypothetical protein
MGVQNLTTSSFVSVATVYMFYDFELAAASYVGRPWRKRSKSPAAGQQSADGAHLLEAAALTGAMSEQLPTMLWTFGVGRSSRLIKGALEKTAIFQMLSRIFFLW